MSADYSQNNIAGPEAGLPAASPDLFERIALSLSGGGFRASAYSLGTLNALYLLGVLDHVHMLSTASGGTLMGAFYALRRKQGASFEQIYHDAYAWLAADEIMPEALRKWRKAVEGRAADAKLIRAFADTYDELLFKQAHFAEFWKPAASPFHLQTVVFGATELYSGLTFRFQYAAFLPETGFTDRYGKRLQSSYYIGNGNVYIPHPDAQQLRLADLAAASSCFPVGFEPLVLPDDFADGHAAPRVRGRSHDATPNNVALIDGGVYDNQGIESLLLANRRNRDYCDSPEYQQAIGSHPPALTGAAQALLQPSTLFLVADVDSAAKNLFDATQARRPGRGPSLRQLAGYTLAGVIVLLAAGGVLLDFAPFRGSFLAGCCMTIGGVAAVLGLLGWLGWYWGTSQLKALDERIHRLAVPVMLRLPLGQWKRLLGVRLRTASVLLMSVFMRRVRSLNYGLLYDRDEAPTQGPVVASIIGGLLRDYTQPAAKDWHNDIGKVRDTVVAASEMGTTLWWGKDLNRVPLITACAGFTLCYRLLRRFNRHQAATAREKEVQRRAQLLWGAHVKMQGRVVIGPEALHVLRQPACTVAQLVAAAQHAPTPRSSPIANP